MPRLTLEVAGSTGNAREATTLVNKFRFDLSMGEIENPK
jgi:hypothetical protein